MTWPCRARPPTLRLDVESKGLSGVHVRHAGEAEGRKRALDRGAFGSAMPLRNVTSTITKVVHDKHRTSR